jgi:hypothetical protein
MGGEQSQNARPQQARTAAGRPTSKAGNDVL